MIEISLEDPLVKGYLFYVSVLVLKTLFMAILIGNQRYKKNIVISPEDVNLASVVIQRETVVKHDDEDIERVRRAHLNDLENIPAFIIAGFVYILTKPNVMVALNLFRAFTIFRILHTIVYAVIVIPQPSRVICFAIGYCITIYMCAMSISYFFYP